MDRCLVIEDILSIIFENLQYGSLDGQALGGPQGDTASLAALTLTCRAFHWPAIRVLWHVQNTLDNLMKTLPPETWKVRGSVEEPVGMFVRFYLMSHIAHLLIQRDRHSQGQSTNTNGSVSTIMLR